MTSFPALRAPLAEKNVTVRLSAERDIPDVLIAYEDDPHLPLALGEDRPPTGAGLGMRAENAAAEGRAGVSVTFAILEGSSDTCRGEVRVSGVDWERRQARVRVWVAPGFRGRGLGRRAHALVCDWLRQACGLEASCAPTGPAQDLPG